MMNDKPRFTVYGVTIEQWTARFGVEDMTGCTTGRRVVRGGRETLMPTILWQPNPLRTVVRLIDHEKEIFWHRLKEEELIDRIWGADFDLDPRQLEWRNKTLKPETLEDAVKKARHRISPKFLSGDGFRVHVDEMLRDYVEELERRHDGDCVCIPCGCLKCRAEDLLGVDTIAGLGKHSAHKIQSAFRPNADGSDSASLDEALEHLRTYRRPVKGPGWESSSNEEFERHVPRWMDEARQAYEWLIKYKQEHFG